MSREWNPVLLGIFLDAREFPGWEAIRSAHDEEDQGCFEIFEELYQSGKLKPLHPSEDPRHEKFAQKELKELGVAIEKKRFSGES